MRLVSKVKPGSIEWNGRTSIKYPWRTTHEDGTVTFHELLSEAKAFMGFTYKWEVEDDQ